MNIQENLTNAMEYTKGLFTDIARLVILIVLDIIPIVNFIVIGYFAKCIKESPASKNPPQLVDYGDLWIQGAKVFVVSLVYMIIPVALIIPIVFTAFAWSLFWGFLFFNWVLLVALGVIGLILSFLFMLILVIAVANMIEKNDLGKAFAFSEILDIIKRLGWGNYILWAIIIFVIGVIVGLIGLIPYVGWLLSLIISPVFGVFVARSVALVYSEGTSGLTPPSPSGPTPEPTPAVTEITETKYCKYCGAKIPADAIYCPNCGGKQ